MELCNLSLISKFIKENELTVVRKLENETVVINNYDYPNRNERLSDGYIVKDKSGNIYLIEEYDNEIIVSELISDNWYLHLGNYFYNEETNRFEFS